MADSEMLSLYAGTENIWCFVMNPLRFGALFAPSFVDINQKHLFFDQIPPSFTLALYQTTEF